MGASRGGRGPTGPWRRSFEALRSAPVRLDLDDPLDPAAAYEDRDADREVPVAEFARKDSRGREEAPLVERDGPGQLGLARRRGEVGAPGLQELHDLAPALLRPFHDRAEPFGEAEGG